jgi:hypothetical protein
VTPRKKRTRRKAHSTVSKAVETNKRNYETECRLTGWDFSQKLYIMNFFNEHNVQQENSYTTLSSLCGMFSLRQFEQGCYFKHLLRLME